MEIKELNFLENLSDNGKKTSVMDSVIGGHDDDYSYSYDFLDYFFHPFFEKEIEVPEPELEVVIGVTAAPSGIGVPGYPF